MMGAANDLIVVFLGLEILSIALYVLAAFNHKRAESGEAALKYFVLGGFSSAVFVYGIALTYGATGSTNLTQIADYLSQERHRCTTACCSAGSPCCWSASPSRWPPCRSTCGRPTSTRARPRRSPASWRPWPRPGAFAALLRVFVSSFGDRADRLAADRLAAWPSAQPGARRRGGPHPAGRQAHDGLLVDQPRRLHPARAWRRARPAGCRPRSTTSSPTCSWPSAPSP